MSDIPASFLSMFEFVSQTDNKAQTQTKFFQTTELGQL